MATLSSSAPVPISVPFPIVSVKSALNPRPSVSNKQQQHQSQRHHEQQQQSYQLSLQQQQSQHGNTTNIHIHAASSSARRASSEGQSLKLPELVVKSAPTSVKKKNRNYIYKYKLLPGNNVRVLLAALRRRPWWHPMTPSSQETDDASQIPTFLWEMYRNPKRYSGLYESVLLNHLQNNNCLVSKKGLYFCMKNYCQEKNIDVLQIIPRTFFISLGSSNNELDAFMEYNERFGGRVPSAKRLPSASPTSAATVAPATSPATTNVPEIATSESTELVDGAQASSAPLAIPVTPAASSPTIKEGVEEQQQQGIIWIMKPASKTNRGFGIKVVQGVNEVMAVVNGRSLSANEDMEDSMIDDGSVGKDNNTASHRSRKAGSVSTNGASNTANTANNGAPGGGERLAALGRDARKKASREGWIVQEYMTRPLLVSGRKFDIRCYVLITCSSPRGIRGYFFKDAYVRTSCKKYSLDALSDREIHLTNDAVQKYSKSYGKFENGNKLSFPEWQAVIDKDYPHAPADIVASKIMPEIKRITGLSLAGAVASNIGESDITKSFELLGYDYMIDDEFQPKLIEINSNPCLEFASPLLEDIITSLIENVVRVGIDTVFPPPAAGHRSKACEAAIAAIEAQESKFELLYH
jgi:hypothetical protein